MGATASKQQPAHPAISPTTAPPICATLGLCASKGHFMQHTRRFMMLTLLLALLVGCGRPAPSQNPVTPQNAVIKPNFTDADPQDFAVKHPKRYPVHGIGAARYQGVIDWQTAARSGVSFAYLKATEGGDGLDPSFATNWQAAAGAGIPRGAFHFFYFCRPAADQARWFIAHVPRSPRALPPVLDMEWTPFSPTCTLRPDAADVRAEAETFLNILERHYGQRPLIYTSPNSLRPIKWGASRAPNSGCDPSPIIPPTPTPIRPGPSGNTAAQAACRACKARLIPMSLLAPLPHGRHGLPCAASHKHGDNHAGQTHRRAQFPMLMVRNSRRQERPRKPADLP